MAAPSQAGKRAASLDREVSVLRALSLLCTVPYGMSEFSRFIVPNSRGEPSLHGGIFPQSFCTPELGEMVAQVYTSWYLIALTTRPLQRDHPPFPHGTAPHLSQTHCLPASTHNPSFIKGFITLLNHGDAQRLPTALSPPSSVRGGAWCHRHCRRTRDFRGCQG